MTRTITALTIFFALFTGARAEDMIHSKVTSGKAQLALVTKGSGPPLVYLHAGVADSRMWNAPLEAFSKTYKTIAYDRRGYGETTYTAENYNVLTDLAAVLDATAKAERVVLIGCSLGGMVASDYALTHPERVKALVLIGSAISGAPEPAADFYGPEIMKLFADTEAAQKAGDYDRQNALEARAWLDGPLAPEGRVSGPRRDLFLDMNGRALRAASPGKNTNAESAYSRFPELKMPILFIVGDFDFADISDTSAHLADVAPSAKLVRLKTAHLPSLEAPESFNATLEDFLAANGL